MLFSEDDTEKQIRVLSGGERARVALARLLVDPGNVMLMDEPTNHLDLESSERLAEALETYEGTLLFVSHNRGFVRRLAQTIWHVQDGKVEVYPGTLDEYMDSMRARRSLQTSSDDGTTAPADSELESPTARKETRAEAKERKRREAEARNRLAPLRKEVKRLEDAIAKLESSQAQRNEQLNDPEVYQDSDRRNEVLAAFQDDKATLEKRTAEWMIASELLDEAEAALTNE